MAVPARLEQRLLSRIDRHVGGRTEQGAPEGYVRELCFSDLVEQMVESGEEPHLGGERQQLRPFSAAQAFSSFSELLTPGIGRFDERLPYRDDQYSSGGKRYLGQIRGDAIVRCMGRPYHGGSCLSIVKTALLMQAKQLELRDKWALEEKKWGKCYGLVKKCKPGSVAIQEPLRLGTWGHWIIQLHHDG